MSYIIELRKALDEAGFADTKIVAPDLNKAAAEAFIQQWLAEPPGSPLRRATYALGFHYPNTLMSDAAHATGLPLWASEDSSTVAVPPDAPCVPINAALLLPLAAPDGGATTRRPTPHPRAKPGGGCLARTFNQNFLNGNISSTVVWNLVTSRPLRTIVMLSPICFVRLANPRSIHYFRVAVGLYGTDVCDGPDRR